MVYFRVKLIKRPKTAFSSDTLQAFQGTQYYQYFPISTKEMRMRILDKIDIFIWTL